MSELAHHDSISQALTVLAEALGPDIEQRLQAAYGDDWRSRLQAGFRDPRRFEKVDGKIDWDAQLVLTVMWDHWNVLFRGTLGHLERSLVSELREFRNQWAHQKPLSFDDAYRVLDSIERLLRALQLAPPAEDVAVMKRELLAQSCAKTAAPVMTANASSAVSERFSPLQTVLITVLCCLFILGQIYISWNTRGWLMMVVVVFVFSLLIYNRVRPLLQKTAL